MVNPRNADPFIDGPRLNPAAAGDLLKVNRAAVQSSSFTGRVVEVLEAGAKARVEYPLDNPVAEGVGPTDSTFSAIGVIVQILIGADGKIAKIFAPAVLPAGSTLIPTGATGEAILENTSQINETQAALAQAQEQLDAAQAKLNDPDTGLEASQSKADDALSAAVQATQNATTATTVANAALAAVPPFVQQATPSATVVGQLWYPLDSSGRVIGMKRASATGTGSWQDYRMVAGQILVPGSVGTTEIGPEGVIAANIKASNELWAKVLAVAGDATIGGRLLAKKIITGDLFADVIKVATRLVAGSPTGDRTELNSSGLHVFKGGDEKVRVSADTSSGLQVRDKTTNTLVDAAAVMMGAFVGHLDAGAATTSPYNSNWGPTYDYTLSGSFVAPTTRAFIAYNTRMKDSFGSATVRVWMAIVDDTAGGKKALGYLDLDASGVKITGTNFHLYTELVIGHTYHLYFSLQVNPFVGTSTGWWRVDEVNAVVIPL